MSHAPVLRSSPGLPNDVMVYIVSNLDHNTLLQIRLCCKWLAKEAARHLFAEVSFQMRAESMERVIALANSSMTAGAVKTIKLFETPRLIERTEENWYYDTEWDPGWESDIDLDYYCVDEATYLKDRERAKQEKIRLYQLFLEYEAQRTEPTLYECLHAPGPSVSGSILTESPLVQDLSWLRLKTKTSHVRRLQKACIDFEEALLKLRNLKEVQAHFSRCQGATTLRWRNHEWFVSYDDYYGLAKNEAISQETAPLAFFLRALGRRNSFSNSLTSLRLDLRMDWWWGLQDLSATWRPKGDGNGEENQAILSKSLTFMAEAFCYFTDIHILFDQRDDMPAFLNSLALFLTQAKKLRRLELKVEIRYNEWLGLDMLAEINKQFLWPGFDMVAEINKQFQWPMLSHLTLQGFTFPKSSILQTLSFAAPTLQSFSLRNCLILGGASPWPHLFEDMRLISFQNLHLPEFRICVQDDTYRRLLNTAPHPWSFRELDSRSIVLIHMRDGGEDYVMGYSSLIYDYILKKTDVMPPLKLFSRSPTDSGSLWA